MSRRICVIDVPGLSRDLLNAVPPGSALGQWLAKQNVVGLTPSWPAVTSSVQATLTTGVPPARHGIVSNGLATFRSPADQKLVDAGNFVSYRREISFWEQSNQFIEAKRFWQNDSGRSLVKTALLFFQNSMPGFVEPQKPSADIVLTPKPDHGPDGKLKSLCWSDPSNLVPELFAKLGPFPLMKYWGPMAGIESSQWIAKAAALVWQKHSPQLQLTYVPHLDYDLQRFGPDSPQAIKAVVDLSAAIEPLLDAVLESGGQIVLLSEYAMKPVTRCIQPNRLLADTGLLVTRDSPDGNLVDYAKSAAFAMVDHQIAHVYVNDRTKLSAVREALSVPDVEILAPSTLAHRRSGELMLQAETDAWFDYRWWADFEAAPVFAKDVDIHRKPGYDACELFFDPAIRGVGQQPSQVRGSHGAAVAGESLLIGIGEQAGRSQSMPVKAVEFATLMLNALAS